MLNIKKIKIVPLILSIFTLLGISVANIQNNVPQFSDPNKTIMVSSKNPNFTINLKSNATTGYTWLLTDYDKSLVVPLGHKYVAPNTNLIGAGGYEEWNFKLKPNAFAVPQTLKITLIYAQPWAVKNAQGVVFNISTHE